MDKPVHDLCFSEELILGPSLLDVESKVAHYIKCVKVDPRRNIERRSFGLVDLIDQLFRISNDPWLIVSKGYAGSV